MINPIDKKESAVYISLILICISVYLLGWLIPLIEIDAAQYANISREMLLHKNFLQLFDCGQDYLDKPPMLFWLSAASMHLFGINDIAYRLPSFLFAVVSIYSTYRLALIFYAERIALLSALVLASCQAMFLITHDVRTDTMLMGWVILGIWQLAEWFKWEKWKNLVIAGIAIAGGLMTKGPIALMVLVFAFVPHFLMQRSFRQFFRWQYIVFLAIISVLLVPMCIGLYRQYDLHPEKIMYGQKAISGLRFYFWTQSFGRITGESTWHENDSFFFLFQNMLWGFLPWIVFFVAGLATDCIQLVKNKFRIGIEREWISTGGFLVTYCALATSRAQLPHYIYVVFPLIAIISARWLYNLLYTDRYRRLIKPFFIFHGFIFLSMSAILFSLIIFPFPPVNKIILVSAIIVFTTGIVVLVKKWLIISSLVTLAVLFILFINIFLDIGFYPDLLQYQMSVKVSSIINEEHLDKDRIFIYRINEERSLDFYSNHFFKHVVNADSLSRDDYMLTNKEGFDLLKKNAYKIIFQGEGFHVSTLTLPFLNPATRKNETQPYFILQRL